ncbi:MAG: MFS transporter [Hyphomicrobiaceae bacterium]
MSVEARQDLGGPEPAGRDRLAALGVYLRPRVLVVLLLGFSGGLPLALTGSTLAIWMADRGVDLGTIGLFSLAGLPYTLKFLWAPLIDALDVPLLARLGRRRGWLLASQIVLMGALANMALATDPVANPVGLALAALTIAIASATQDIVIDAFRVESLKPKEQAAGMASYVAAYRIAMLVSGAGAIGLVAWMEGEGLDRAAAWRIAYLFCGLLTLVGILAVLVSREPAQMAGPVARAAEGDESGAAARPARRPLRRVLAVASGAFGEFLTRPAALAILAFVVLYKLCDALAGVMTGPFVLALGYDKATYAAIVKGVGLAATLVGGFAGGALARSLSLAAALWIGAILQMASNLAFAWLAGMPVATWALTVAVVVESFTGGIGTVIFVAYISALCRSPLHTATQFALLTALAATGRTFLASYSGFMAEGLGWPLFFVVTAIAAVPSLVLLASLGRRGHFAPLATAPAGRSAAEPA